MIHTTSLSEVSRSQWVALVNEAFKLRREGHVLDLATSPLAQSSLVAPCFLSDEPISADVRGRALQSVLRWAVDRLRPGGRHSWTALNWRPYNILHSFYIRGLKVAELAERMAIANQTLYKIRPQAIEAAAELLRHELDQPQFADERKNYALADRYNRCSPEEQLLLRAASIFEGPVPYRWLHQLTQIGHEENAYTQTHIYKLSQERLLMNRPTHRELMVHPEIRAYLLIQLEPHESKNWHRKAGQLYDAEQQDYLAAAYHLRRGRDFEAAAHILLSHYQEVVDNLKIDELATLLREFQRTELDTVDTWARLNIVIGRIAEWQGALDVALDAYRVGLQAEDPKNKTEAFYRRGRVFENLDIDAAQAHYQQGIEILERQGMQDALLVKLLIHHAWIFIQNRPDLERAAADLQRAREAVQFSDRQNRADLNNAWAELCFRRGELAQATRYRLRAWTVANELQDMGRMLKFEYNLGMDYAHQQRYDKALERLEAGKALAVESGNQEMAGAYYKGIANCYFWQGAYQEAVQQDLLAYHNFVEAGNKKRRAHVCYDLAEAYSELQDIAQGQRYFAEGLKMAQALGDRLLIRDFSELAHTYPTLNMDSSLNERQRTAIAYVKQHGSIANRHYRDLTGISQKQAARDLNELVERDILVRVGRGRATRYRTSAASQEA